MKEALREELQGWKKWEISWMVFSCAVITALSIYWKDSPIGITSALTGVICVICTGKGKLSAYVFGAVNTILYALISYRQKYYGEVMLNALYYFPLQFYGFHVWKKNINSETHEVNKRSLSPKGLAIMLCSVGCATLAYGLILKHLGGKLPYVDALSTVVSVVAMIISIKMYAEQWILWIIVDVVTVFMWAFAFAQGKENISTLIMWIIYLGNAVIMYVKWYREAKK